VTGFVIQLVSKTPSFPALFFAAILVSLTAMSSQVQAQTFANIPALSFTKNFGGANPLPQVIAVPSVGPTFDFTSAASTTTGGSWLQRMKEDNITSGCTATTYCPNSPVTRGDMATFVMRGAFNELLPATEPILLSISPATITHGGSPATYTITGFNTHFQNGVTALGALARITAGAVTVVNETTLTVQLSAASDAALEPLSPLAITGAPPGNEEAVLPNGLTVQ